jgi:hypothetical protein
MAQGRGSDRAVVLALVLLCGLLHGELAESKVYTVDWNFNSGSWPQGKSFRAGDVLCECSGRSNYFMYPGLSGSVIPLL